MQAFALFYALCLLKRDFTMTMINSMFAFVRDNKKMCDSTILLHNHTSCTELNLYLTHSHFKVIAFVTQIFSSEMSFKL